ncbi:MAG: TIGR02281 family clan AA aspartic protease [Pseudomonadota bacterium]
MRSDFVFAVLVVIVAILGVRFLEVREHAAAADMATLADAAPPTFAAAAPPPSDYYSGTGAEVRILPGAHDQFFVTAAVNRNPASFLIDTGASYVALRESDALASGIYTKLDDYVHPVRTANGETNAAMVTLRTVEIDNLRVDDVKAFILPDDQLGVNLLGMSFLSRLESVEARRGELVLRG